MRDAAGGLQHAHVKSLVHQDLKPENFMWARLPEGGDRVIVIDFGLGRVLAGSIRRAQR